MRLGMATHTPQLPRKPRGLMIQSRYHMHVVASAPSPQRGSKWHRQALPSLECFLLISVSGNGNAPRAQSLGAAAPEACEEDHVHLHLCFNSASLFHKRGLGALDIFAFEGISPHVVPNKASGGAYADAARVGVGFQRRLGDVRAAEQYLKEQAMRDLVEEEQAALANSMLPMKSFPEVELFLSHFAGQPKFRRRKNLGTGAWCKFRDHV